MLQQCSASGPRGPTDTTRLTFVARPRKIDAAGITQDGETGPWPRPWRPDARTRLLSCHWLLRQGWRTNSQSHEDNASTEGVRAMWGESYGDATVSTHVLTVVQQTLETIERMQETHEKEKKEAEQREMRLKSQITEMNDKLTGLTRNCMAILWGEHQRAC